MCIAVISNNIGELFTVSFEHKYQLETWINMELNIHNKRYKIIKIMEDKKWITQDTYVAITGYIM